MHDADKKRDLDKIRSLSKKLATFCLLTVVALPFAVPYTWVGDIGFLAQRANILASNIQNPIEDWQRVVGALLTAIPVILMCVGLWRVRLCFLSFSQGQVFTAAAVNHLREFAVWMMRSAIAALIVGGLLSSLLTIGNAPGTRLVAIGVSTEQILLLFFSGVVWLMADIIRRGQDLAQENSTFI
jgi:Protein of unknown function (DUF2975)